MMALTGKAKIDYQREYMRRRRSNQRSNVTSQSVRPDVTGDVRPKLVAKELPLVEEFGDAILAKGGLPGNADPDRHVVDQQSYNPMMVGYVPPKE